MPDTPDDTSNGGRESDGSPRTGDDVHVEEEQVPASHSVDDTAQPSAGDGLRPRLSRRTTLLGIGGLGLTGALTGLSTADSSVSAIDEQTLAVAGGASTSESSQTVGTGARAIHEGTFVIGDSSPRVITSRGPDEVRSQVPIYAPAFQTTSARAAKTDVEPVDPETILEGVESLSISTWQFTDADDGRHIGPMAGDFQDEFELGSSDDSIATVDADGVALAAIQGLVERLESEGDRLEAAIERRRERIADLESRLDALEEEVSDE